MRGKNQKVCPSVRQYYYTFKKGEENKRKGSAKGDVL